MTVAYGCAHFGKISLWYASEILFAYYLSEVCGLPPSQMGLILAASFVLSAAADLLVARALHERLHQVARAIDLQLLGAVSSSIALLALFLGASVPAAWQLAYGLVFAAAFRLSYVVLDLPQNVLMSIATTDASSRARLASMRTFCSSVAALLISASLLPLMSRQATLPVAARFILLAMLLAILAVLSASALKKALATRAHSIRDIRTIRAIRATPATPATPATSPASASVVAEGRLGLRLSAPMWRNIAIGFLVTMTVSCFGKVAPFYNAYFLSAVQWGSYVLPAASLGAALSQVVWASLATRISTNWLLGVAACMLAMAATAFCVGAAHPVLAISAAFCIGAGSSGMGMTLWAAFAGMAADQHRVSVALAYGTLTASLKIALACGAGAIGLVLSMVDYRKEQSAVLVHLMSIPSIAAVLIMALVSVATYAAHAAYAASQMTGRSRTALTTGQAARR
ncbi:MAG: MFS transporter [Janthinobacterium lividum]|nr:MFS transporter [Janthinobacterium lividum]